MPVRRPWDRADRAAAWLLLLGLGLRVGLTTAGRGETERLLQVDSAGYLRMAANLPAYLSGDYALLSLSVRRPPGYPLFLHLLTETLGLSLYGAMLVQAALASSTVLIVYRIGRRLATARGALVAAAIAAVDPSLVAQAPFVLTEALFTVLVLLAVLLVVPGGGTTTVRTRHALLAGVLLGAATLVRPVGLLLGPVLVPAVLLRSGDLRRRLIASSVLLGGALGIAGAWMVHNESRAGITSVSSITAVQLLEYRAAGLAALEPGASTLRERILTGHEAEEEVERLRAIVAERLPEDPTLAEEYAATSAVALELLRADPIGTARVVGEGVVRTLIRPTLAGRTQWALVGQAREDAVPPRAAWLLAVVEALYLAVLYGAAVIGGWLLAQRRRWADLAVLLLPSASLLVLSAGLESYSRFRGPIMPFLALLAGLGVQQLLLAQRWSLRARREASGAGKAPRHPA